MKTASVMGCVLAGCGLCLSVHLAHAQESPVGFYLGAGIGPSTIRQNPESDTGYYGLVRDEVGWNAVMGVRPLPYLGAEIGYVDFGSAHRYDYFAPGYSSTFDTLGHESASAPVAFAVGYLPLSPPWWDLYLKAGTARLHKSWDFIPQSSCFTPGPCVVSSAPSYAGAASEWDFAYGIGTQLKFGPLAYRLEYERVNANSSAGGGDPDLLSIGVAWTFF